jgi:hypothetical protein
MTNHETWYHGNTCLKLFRWTRNNRKMETEIFLLPSYRVIGSFCVFLQHLVRSGSPAYPQLRPETEGSIGLLSALSLLLLPSCRLSWCWIALVLLGDSSISGSSAILRSCILYGSEGTCILLSSVVAGLSSVSVFSVLALLRYDPAGDVCSIL